MRPLGIGLATAFFLTALASASASLAGIDSTPARAPGAMQALADNGKNTPPAAAIDPEARARGKKDAPALIAQAHIPCTMTDAIYAGSGTGSDKIHASFYEVACKEGLGFVLISKDKTPPATAFDCVVASTPTPDGKPSNLACKLPENANRLAGLQPYVTKSGRNCTISNGKYVGSSASENIYEVTCSEGGGYLLETARDFSGTPKTTNCVDYDPAGTVKCTLITREQQFAAIDKLAANAGKPCTIKDRRYVGTTPEGADFFEFACSDGSGFMTKSDASGKFLEAVQCAKAAGIAGGCTLTDARQAETQENNLYTSLAKKAGFDCNVSKYADFPTADNSVEIVELACSNRPDGGVGFFPASTTAKPQVLNCLRSEAEGYRCSFTPTSALYSSITAQLKAKGHASCVVSDARPFAMGTSKDSSGKADLIEVGCADGGPGLVIDYEYGSQTPGDLLNCAQVASMSGGCQLPNNKKKS